MSESCAQAGAAIVVTARPSAAVVESAVMRPARLRRVFDAQDADGLDVDTWDDMGSVLSVVK
ncbi:hypothetical protein AVL63_10580 [Nesterenkonia jeotgali]|uniref:Uncharacterized protein n=1 Tax=Nesterenkonia jeotgali TaxID=317018 RepID=A0A0W8II60_9MICC|nr:hypothetical protein AVL63_10580 [Nesterenkonia jeotgali]